MTHFWLICCGIALFGMSVGVATGDKVTFGINAVAFMFDAYMLLFTEN